MSKRPILDRLPPIPGYQLLEELGRGAASRVFRARQVALDRDVALKVIVNGEGAGGATEIRRLQREARLLGSLDHPGIVRAIDVGAFRGVAWYTMELIQGRDLERVIHEQGPFPAREVIRMGIEILDALEHAHQAGIVHRDLKPANILLDPQGHVHLLDLGLARRVSDARLTRAGGTLGTPQYMSPEQARHPERVDGRSDLWSVGATLYACLEGHPPFGEGTLAEVITRLLYEEPAPLQGQGGVLPLGLVTSIQRALQKEPHRRQKSAADFRGELVAVAEGRPVAPLRRFKRRLPIWSWALLLLPLGLLGLWLALSQGPEGGRGKRREATPPPAHPRAASKDPRSGETTLSAAATPWELVERLARLAPLLASVKGAQQTRLLHLKKKLQAALLRRAASQTAKLEKEAREALQAGQVEVARDVMERRLAGMLPPDWVARLAAPALARDLKNLEEAARQRFHDARQEVSLKARRQMCQLLEGLPAQQEFEFFGEGEEPLRRRIAARLAEIGPLAQLLPEDLAVVATRRRQVLARILRSARKNRSSRLDRIQELLGARRYLSARRALKALPPPRQSPSSSQASKQEEFSRRIREGISSELSKARQLRKSLERPGIGALDMGSMERLLKQLRAGLARLPPAGEVAGLTPLREALEHLERALAGVFKLAPLALAAARSLPRAALSLNPRPRGKPALGDRPLVGVQGDKLLFGRASGRVSRALPARDLSVRTLAPIIQAAGLALDPPALALKAYLDGEDLEAARRAAKLADLPLRGLLKEYLRDARAAKLAALKSVPEREAWRLLQQARGLSVEGKLASGVALLEKLLHTARQGALGNKSPWWRRERAGAEELLADMRQRLRLEQALKPYRGQLELLDLERGRLEVAVQPGLGPLPPFLIPPPGATPGKAGLSLTPADTLTGPTPEEVPGLILKLPKLPFTRLEFSGQVRFEEREPPGFLALTAPGTAFLGLDSLRDGRPFAGEALHGLEHKLWQPTQVARALFWEGPLKSFRRAWSRGRLGFHLPAGKPLAFLLVLDASKGEARLRLEKKQIRTSWRGGGRGGGRLELKVWPRALVSRIGFKLHLLP